MMGALLLAVVACTSDGTTGILGTPSVSPLANLQPNTPSSRTPTPTGPTVSPVNAFPTRTPSPVKSTRVVPTTVPRTPVPVATPVPTPVPAIDKLEIYARGEFQNGYGTFSVNAPSPEPAFTGRQYLDGDTLFKNLRIANGTGDFMSVFDSGDIDLNPFTHVRIVLTSLSGTGSWISINLAVQPWEPGESSSHIYVPPGGWHTFTVPIEEIDTLESASSFRGIGFKGESGPGARNSDNPVAFAEISLVRVPDVIAPRLVAVSNASAALLNVEFSEPTTSVNTSSFILTSVADPIYLNGGSPRIVNTFESGRFVQLMFDPPLVTGSEYTLSVSGIKDAANNSMSESIHDVRPAVNLVVLSVDATKDINAFTPKIRGVTMQTSSWIWGGIVDPDSPRRAALLEATSRIKPGVIRFAGGLWANSTGWDRANAAPADGEWLFVDDDTGRQFEYRHAYKPEMIDSYAAFAMELGAETILQVNICDNNPAMWADLVRYTNIENDYAFRYWEPGDRIDLNNCLSTFEYAERFSVYADALKAVDPTIKIVGPSPSGPQRTQWIDTLSSLQGEDLDVLSFQWYPLTGWSTNTSALEFETGSADALLNYNSAVGFGCWVGWGCNGRTVDSDDISRIRSRRAIAETVSDSVLGSFVDGNPNGETAITGFGPHAWQPHNPINGNHVGAVWLADMLGRWAYNGLDILTFNGLETGGTGKGDARGVLGIDDTSAFDVRPAYYSQWLYAQHFGDVLVQSSTSDESQEVVVWASRDTSDPNVLKLMLLNLGPERAMAQIQIEGFAPTLGEAYVMSSTTPTSVSNPESFTEHQTSINGVVLSDVTVASPNEFTEALDSIRPITVNVGQTTSYELQPYSVTALTLRR